MPNWKKVVTSGSNAQLNQVTASAFKGDGSALTNLPDAAVTALNNKSANRLVTIGSTTTELDGEANLIFDGSNLGIGETSPDELLHIKSSTAQKPTIKLENAGDVTSGGQLHFVMSTTSEGDNDIPGTIRWKAMNDANTETEFATIYVKNIDVSEDEEDSEMHFRTQNGGTLDSTMMIKSGRVGIGNTDPTYRLDVSGNAGINEYLYHNGDTDTFLRFQDNRVDISAGGNALQLSSTKISGSLASTGSFGRLEVDIVNLDRGDSDAQIYGGATGVGIGRAFLQGGGPQAVFHLSSSVASTMMKIQGPSDSNGLEITSKGTAENYPLLKLQSNDTNTEVLYAAQSGNVGFGATSGLKGKIHVAGNIHTTSHITASGNFSQSLQSTGSFGRIEASTLAGHSPLVIDADINFGAGIDISGSISSTGSFGRVEATKLAGDGSEITGLTAAAVQTYNSAADNRVLTSVNSTTIQGESGLTYDGNELRVQGDIVAENYIISSSTTFMTSSFSSGNTIFGDTPTDTHKFTGSLDISGSINSATPTLKVHGSGSGIFEVKGTSGTLFSVNDIMSGSIFSSNTIAGIPVIEAFSDQKVNLGPVANQIQIDTSGNLLPGVDAAQDLGSSSKRFANIYSADFHLSNENTQGNDIDGTNGNWTIQEGEEDLYLLNNKNGKKYKFKLEEIK